MALLNFNSNKNSRREFLIKTSVLSAGVLFVNNLFAFSNTYFLTHNKTYTVQQIIDLILAEIPVDPINNTVDTIKFGNGKQIVT